MVEVVAASTGRRDEVVVEVVDTVLELEDALLVVEVADAVLVLEDTLLVVETQSSHIEFVSL